MNAAYSNSFKYCLLAAFGLIGVVITLAFKTNSAIKPKTNVLLKQQEQLIPSQPTAQNRKNYLLNIDQQKIALSKGGFADGKTSRILKVPVIFSNRSNDTLKYLTMSCSWDDIFTINNKDMGIQSWACDKNVQTIRILLPGASETYNVPVFIRDWDARNIKFRVGINLIIINEKNQNSIFDFDLRSARKENLIWSNEVTIN